MTITGGKDETLDIGIHILSKQSNKSLCSINNKTFLENRNLYKFYYQHF